MPEADERLALERVSRAWRNLVRGARAGAGKAPPEALPTPPADQLAPPTETVEPDVPPSSR